jgi:hypothetical protein
MSVHTRPAVYSPDGHYRWDGEQWKPVVKQAPSQGLSSWVGTVTSEDLFYGQTVLVWARWILIGAGLVLSFWNPNGLLTLQVQLAAIIALAFGNFYLHVQLLRGRPVIDRVVYGASLGDIAVVTALVIVQGGYVSPVFIFYFAAVLGFSVAFPTALTAAYAAVVLGVYGVICLATAGAGDYPAVFTRELMIAAIAVCGNLFARSESHRRTQAVREHQPALEDQADLVPTA